MSLGVSSKSVAVCGQQCGQAGRMGQIQSVYGAPHPPIRDCNPSLYVYRMSRHRRPEGGGMRANQEWWREQLLSRQATEQPAVTGAGELYTEVVSEQGGVKTGTTDMEQVSDRLVGESCTQRWSVNRVV